MVEQFPRDIPLDEKGNIKVLEELDILEKLKEMGFEIDDMQDILFKDIEEYKRRRDLTLDIYFQEKMNELETDQEDNENEESDLVLVGSPLDIEDIPVYENEDIYQANINKMESSEVDEEKDQNATNVVTSSITGKGMIDLSDDRNQKKNNIKNIGEKKTPGNKDKEKKIIIKKNNKGKKRGGKWNPIIFVLFVTIILIVSSTSGYFIIRSKREQTIEDEFNARFKISDLNPLAGSILNLTGECNEPGLKFQWVIIPDDFTITKGNLFTRSLEIFFKTPRDYRIDLSVYSSGDDRKETKYISVANIDIGISREKFGDIYSYDASGHFFMENIDHFFHKMEVKKFKKMDIDYWTEESNPMKIEIADTIVNQKDGLACEYYQSLRITDQFIKFSGTISTGDNTKTTITGNSDTVQQNYIDLYTKKLVRTSSDVNMNVLIPFSDINTFDREIHQEQDLFPDLDSVFSDLRIEDLSEGRNFSIGDEGTSTWGSVQLNWKALEADMVGGKRSIRLNFQMDGSNKKRMDIETFQMDHWINEITPVPIRTRINITSEQSIDNPYELFHDQILKNYNPGEDIIYYGSLDYDHKIFHSIDEIYSTLENDPNDKWDILPLTGNFGGTFSSTNDPGVALSIATEKQSYKTWENENENAFVIYSNFTRISNVDTWKFSISEKDKSWGYNSTVANEIATGFIGKIEPVNIDKKDLPKIFSFSGSEYAFKLLLSDIDSDLTTEIYGKASPSKYDVIIYDDFNIGTRVDHDYPLTGLFNPVMYRPIEMCMIIESRNGELTLGIDMSNGQLSYIQSITILDH